jgi:hypothetical protein
VQREEGVLTHVQRKIERPTLDTRQTRFSLSARLSVAVEVGGIMGGEFGGSAGPSARLLEQLSQSPSAVAFEQAKAEILALIAAGGLQALNRDPGKAARTMLTGYGNVKRFLPDIEALPHLKLDRIKTLERNLQAFAYTDGLVGVWKDAPRFDEELLEKVRAARRVLLASFELCVARGLLKREEVTLSGGGTPLDQIKDVRRLGLALKASWDKVGTQIGGDPEAIEQTFLDADALTKALAAKDELEEQSRMALAMRSAAWTLCVLSYQELERAVEYLRFHEKDSRTLLPSPFTVPRGPGSRDGDDEASDSEPQTDRGTDPAPDASTDAAGGVAAGPGANMPAAPVKPSKPFE